MSEIIENNELAVVEQSTTAQFDFVDTESAAKYMQNYQDTIKVMLDDSDYQKIGGKAFKKKSAWRKLATAFRISDNIIKEEIVRDDTNQIVSAKYYVEARLANGRSSVGVGSCSIFDKIRYTPTKYHDADTSTPSNFTLRGRFSNAEHDVPSTAHSRAKNRAISDLIGAGEVSAEEMGSAPTQSIPKQTPKAPAKPTKTPKTPVVEAEIVKPKKTPKTGDSKMKTPIHVETVQDTKFDVDKVKENTSIMKAVIELEANGQNITKNNIKSKLLDLVELGTVLEVDYKEAVNLLE